MGFSQTLQPSECFYFAISTDLLSFDKSSQNLRFLRSKTCNNNINNNHDDKRNQNIYLPNVLNVILFSEYVIRYPRDLGC